MNDPYELAKTVLETADAPAPSASMALYGAAVQGADAGENGCCRFHLENESGTGDSTLYRVFPCIELFCNENLAG